MSHFFAPTRLVLAAAIASLVCAVSAQTSIAGKPTKEQILQALAPTTSAPGETKVRTRGLALDSAPAAEAPAQAAKGAAAPAQAAKAAPAAKAQARALDLDIPFEFASDRLTNDGKEVLDQLGEALNSDALAGAKSIILEGHTDAKGNAAYNKMLSLRRAQSVRTYLSSKHKVSIAKLKAVGKGSVELADPNNPEDGVNRRVRIIVEG